MNSVRDMVDLHTHILPDLDDGSHSVEESIEMLTLLHEQGVEVVVATPHFYARRESLISFLSRRERAFNQLENHIASMKIVQSLPEIRLGAEVYYFRGISKISEIRNLVIEGTNLLLLELPFTQWDTSILEEIKRIEKNLCVQVVLAHIDRYYAIRQNRPYIRDLIESGICVQLNISAFCTWSTRHFVKDLLRRDVVLGIGSDCHNMSARKPEWDRFQRMVQKNPREIFLIKNIHKNLKFKMNKVENKNTGAYPIK